MTLAFKRPQRETRGPQNRLTRNAAWVGLLCALSLPATPAIATIAGNSGQISLRARSDSPDTVKTPLPINACWGQAPLCTPTQAPLTPLSGKLRARINAGPKSDPKKVSVRNNVSLSSSWNDGRASSMDIDFSNAISISAGDKNSHPRRDLKKAGAGNGSTWIYGVTFTTDTTLDLKYLTGGADDIDTWSFQVVHGLDVQTLVASANGFGSLTQSFAAGSYSFIFSTAMLAPEGLTEDYDHLLSGLLSLDFTENAVAAPAIPEPASWAFMVGGFGLIGGAMRSSRWKPASPQGSGKRAEVGT